MSDLKVFDHKGILVTDSRDVAEWTEKEHKTLLRDIRKYIQYFGTDVYPSDFFIESYFQDAYGRNQQHFLLTKKGCDMVANKMTGRKGVLFTAAYVNKFEQMKKDLENKQTYNLPSNYKEALLQLVEAEEEKERLQTDNKQLQVRNKQLEPIADYAQKILNNPGIVTMTSISKDYGMSATKMNELLHNMGIQYKRSGQWFLYSKYDGKGYVHSETFPIEHRDGRQDVSVTTKWTQRGRLFLYRILKDEGIIPDIEKQHIFQLEEA